MGIDQGTTNTKAVALDAEGRLLAVASRPLPSHASAEGWVEQDAGAMLDNVVQCVRQVLEACAGREVAGVGLANQTETLCLWDALTGAPLMPAMTWQCRRGEAELAPLRTASARRLVRERTGLDLDPTFTAAKLRWLARHRPELAGRLHEGSALWGTVDCWLMWSLTGGAVYATDASNASRTALLDIERLGWDQELMGLFELRLGRMPEVRPSAGAYGLTRPGLFDRPLPLTGALGDQQASLFGQGCFAPGEVKATYGTGAFLWLNAGDNATPPRGEGLLRTVAWLLHEPCYACEGFVMSAGATLEWLARQLRIERGGSGVIDLAQATGESAGVCLVPALQGLAAPWWRPQARAALLGMSEATRAGHLCHAALEALCHQVRALTELLALEQPAPRAPLRVDGGLTRSPYLMQLQADILGQPIAVATVEEVTARGAALMAGLGAGLWKEPEQLRAVLPAAREHRPVAARAAGWSEAYRAWRRTVEGLLALA